jgi:phosphoglycerate dehydrogenase-like enzyme
MTNDGPDVLVLREKIHGMGSQECTDALEALLPEYDIRTARTAAAERELIEGASVAVGLHIDEELIRRAEKLEYFAAASAGIGHLPMEALEAAGVVVTNASGVHVPNIPEHVIGWMLTIARRLDEGMRRQREARWQHYQAFGELAGSTVTVVGLGPIGNGIVERLEPFGVETIGVRYTPEKGGPTDEVIGFEDAPFQEALSRTDYLVLACPLTDTTRGLVDGEAFGTLPSDAVVVNIGRGPIIDTDALLGALRGNDIHKAALDVTDPEPLPAEHPLWDFDDVLITPHMSGYTGEYWDRVADIVAENVRAAEDADGGLDFGSGTDLRNRVGSDG